MVFIRICTFIWSQISKSISMLKDKDSIKDLHYNERIISIANPAVKKTTRKWLKMWSFGAALTATIWCAYMDMIPYYRQSLTTTS